MVIFVTGAVWVFFVSRSINVFGEHLRHERDILWEAKLLLDSVCDLPRSSYPLTGKLVRCDEAREAVRRGNAHLKAIELTSTKLLSELARTARNELVDVTWALGFVGVIATIGIGMLWYLGLRAWKIMERRRQVSQRRQHGFSPIALTRFQQTYSIPEETPLLTGVTSLNPSSSDDDSDDEYDVRDAGKWRGYGVFRRRFPREHTKTD